MSSFTRIFSFHSYHSAHITISKCYGYILTSIIQIRSLTKYGINFSNGSPDCTYSTDLDKCKVMPKDSSLPIYQVMNQIGSVLDSNQLLMPKTLVLEIYKQMVVIIYYLNIF